MLGGANQHCENCDEPLAGDEGEVNEPVIGRLYAPGWLNLACIM